MQNLFLCYRRAGAQTAKLFNFYMKKNHPEINVWYSDMEREGNYAKDITPLIKKAYGAVIFISEGFTDGFLDGNGNISTKKNCITVHEIIEIEKNMQNRKDFELHTVNLCGATLTKKDQKILKTVFEKAGILKPDSVIRFAQRNLNPFDTARDHEDSFFDRMIGSYLPGDIESLVHGNLSIGTYPTTVEILCWDCKQFISPESIVYELDGQHIPLYDKIKAARYYVKTSKQDDDVFSVVQFEQYLSTNEEKKQLLIKAKLEKHSLFRKALGMGRSNSFPMNKEIASYLNAAEDDRVYPIPNAMGLALMVLTSDNKLVFSRRSTKREVRPDEFDCSIVEGLLPEVKDKDIGGKMMNYSYMDPEYIQYECQRAFCEEVCVANDLSIHLFGLILDRKYGQWNLVGFIRTGLTSSEIENLHPTRNDTTEKNKLYFVDYQAPDGKKMIEPIREAVRLYRSVALWDTALAVLFGTLSSLGFSQEEIESIL